MRCIDVRSTSVVWICFEKVISHTHLLILLKRNYLSFKKKYIYIIQHSVVLIKKNLSLNFLYNFSLTSIRTMLELLGRILGNNESSFPHTFIHLMQFKNFFNSLKLANNFISISASKIYFLSGMKPKWMLKSKF